MKPSTPITGGVFFGAAELRKPQRLVYDWDCICFPFQESVIPAGVSQHFRSPTAQPKRGIISRYGAWLLVTTLEKP